MTAKQALRDYIEELSDDEALALFQRLESEAQELLPPLTDEQRASVQRGLAQSERHEGIPHEEVLRQLGIR